MNTIRVLLADDHVLVRSGIRSILERLSDLEVVGEAADGHEALRLVKQQGPDVVLMDIAMPRLNGLDATARITADFPAVKVIILSMHATKAYVVEALRAGASGYMLKNAVVDELATAIATVSRGEKYLTPAISAQVIAGLTDLQSSEAATPEVLTTRQREVLQLIAEGRSAREIAELLHLSSKTVDTHRALLMQRLKIYDVAGLTRYAIRVGLIHVDE